jgi:hypothetical protein
MIGGEIPAAGADDRRRRARMAIAELFLDTELDDQTLRRLRDVLRASGFSLSDLDGIYADEVAPILYRNLNSPAGVWDGFDADWLEQEIRRQVGRRRLPALARLRRYLATRSTIRDWRRLRAMVGGEEDTAKRG